jgi:hypothetical protein
LENEELPQEIVNCSEERYDCGEIRLSPPGFYQREA